MVWRLYLQLGVAVLCHLPATHSACPSPWRTPSPRLVATPCTDPPEPRQRWSPGAHDSTLRLAGDGSQCVDTLGYSTADGACIFVDDCHTADKVRAACARVSSLI